MKLIVHAPGTKVWHVHKYEIGAVTRPAINGDTIASTFRMIPRLRCASVASVYGPSYMIKGEDGRDYYRACEAVATTEAAAAAHATAPQTLRHYMKAWPDITTPRLFRERYGAEGHAVFEVLQHGTKVYFDQRYRRVKGKLQPVIMSGVITAVFTGQCFVLTHPQDGMPLANTDVHPDRDVVEAMTRSPLFIADTLTLMSHRPNEISCWYESIASSETNKKFTDYQHLAARLRMLDPARHARAA